MPTIVPSASAASGGPYITEAEADAKYVHYAVSMDDDDSTDNAAYLQGLLDAGGVVVLPPTASGRYAIAGPLTVTVRGTTILAHGAPIRQTTAGQTLFDVEAADVTIDGLFCTGATGTPDLSGMSSSWQGSIVASRWTAVNAYAGAHRLNIPWIRGEGMSNVVRLSGWDADTAATSLFTCEDVTIGTLLADRVEFGLSAKHTTRLAVGNVRGTYGNVSNAPRASHLLYFADNDLQHTQTQVESVAATAGEGGTAVQAKGVIGGRIGAIDTSGCEGTLYVADCEDLEIGSVVATGELGTGDGYGSILVDESTATERVRFRSVNMGMAATAECQAVQVLAGSDVVFDDIHVTTSHTVTGTSANYDVEIRGTNTRVEKVTVDNTGATDAWKAIGVWSGTGHVVRNVTCRNVRIGVDTRTTDALVEYDPDLITLHGTDGLMKATVTSASGALFRTPQSAPLLAGATVADPFDLPIGSGLVLGATSTGQAWSLLAGTWVIASGEAYESGGSTNRAAVVDTGLADADVSATILFQSSEGLVFRATDASNYLGVRLSTTQAVIFKRASGANSDLATVSRTHVVGRNYRVGVRVFGADIEMVVDGAVVLSHTLTAGDETTYASQELHGLRSSGSSAARFDDFRVTSLV